MAFVVAAFWFVSRAAHPFASHAAIALSVLLSAWILAPVLQPGPDLVAMVFPAAMLYTLSRSTGRWVSVIVLAGLQVLWANMSPTHVVGPLLCLAYVAGSAYRQRRNEEPSGAGVAHYLVCGGAALLCCFAQPYGLAGFTASVLDMLGVEPQMTGAWISSYAGLVQHSLPKHLTTLVLAIGAGGLLTYRERLPLGLTLAGIIGLLCCFSTRHLELFGLLVCPFMALSLSSLVATRDPRQMLLTVGTVVVAGFTLFAMTTNRYAAWSGGVFRFSPGGQDQQTVSGLAVRWLTEHAENDARIFHHPHDAGYLLWQRPQTRVVIDPRRSVHGEERLHGYVAACAGEGDAVRTALDEVEPDIVLVNLTWPGGGRLARGLLASGFWQQAYVDGASLVLVPRAEAADYTDLVKDGTGPQMMEGARRAVRDAVEDGRFSSRVATMVGAGELYFGLGMWREAAAAYELVCGTYATMAEGWYRLGFAYAQLDDLAAAESALQRAMELRPGEERYMSLTADVLERLGREADAKQLRQSIPSK